MFTGIIEQAGTITAIEQQGSNVHFTIQASFANELKVDQSVAHNGVCLTVTEVVDNSHYKVTAIDETLQKTNLGDWKKSDLINLERCVKADSFLDGHIVQGHVDQTATCTSKENKDGSWIFRFSYATSEQNLIVKKGSICINGVSLTVVDDLPGEFSVAIIPYTFEHTGFKTLDAGMKVNLEFDIIGKYVAKMMRKSS
jgi:riboflavin synthase